MKPQQQKVSFVRATKSAVLLAIIAALLAISVAPGMTKPLFVKYYRALYKAEAVRTL